MPLLAAQTLHFSFSIPRGDVGAQGATGNPGAGWRGRADRGDRAGGAGGAAVHEVAAEARAKIVYERLINFCDDPGTKQALQFLMTREITHMRAFMQALENLGKHPLSSGLIPPTPGIVDQFLNTSTGTGDQGEEDVQAPWNTAEGIEVIEAPALEEYQVTQATPKAGKTTRATEKTPAAPPVTEDSSAKPAGRKKG